MNGSRRYKSRNEAGLCKTYPHARFWWPSRGSWYCIGRRAGRYGLSTVGEVGATSKRDLKVIRQLFAEQADVLTHARVAPTVEDLELIPGSLASKLTQWSQLQSIPESLRSAIQTADM